MIPDHMRAQALAAYRDGDSPAEVHRLIWPTGGAPITSHTLATVLKALAEDEDARAAVSNASDELPDELADAEDALRNQRKRLVEALEAGACDQEDGEGVTTFNPMYDKLLIENVKAHVAVSKHRVFLQRHRAHHPPADFPPPSSRRKH